MAAGCRADLTWPAIATDQSMLASTRVGLFFVGAEDNDARTDRASQESGLVQARGSSEQARSDKMKRNANDCPRTAKQSTTKY